MTFAQVVVVVEFAVVGWVLVLGLAGVVEGFAVATFLLNPALLGAL